MIALRAELLEHPFGDFVRAVVLGDFLAHEEDVLIALHLLGHGLAESFSVLNLSAWVNCSCQLLVVSCQ